MPGRLPAAPGSPWVLRCTAQFVILLAAPPHSSRQLLCPAPSFIHSLLPYCIAPCSPSTHCVEAMCRQPYTKSTHNRQHSFDATHHTVRLPPFHSLVATSFEQGAVHPLPILLCSPAGHRLRSGAVLAQSHAHACMSSVHAAMPRTAPSLCAHHHARAWFYCAPQSLALAGSLRSFVPHSLRPP